MTEADWLLPAVNICVQSVVTTETSFTDVADGLTENRLCRLEKRDTRTVTVTVW